MTTIEEDLSKELSDAWDQIIKSPNCTNINTFGSLMRYLGQNLPPTELANILGGNMSKQQFLDMQGSVMTKETTDEDVLEAFKVFDKNGNGRIDMSDLRFLLSNQGDKLDVNICADICSRISTQNGSFDFRDLVNRLSN
eukprot:TRINITY_DN11_c0_g1_i1.p1 TRINITY_DN11_c0_g1~~TRINITY_DN11_c0_g1_i1.p1  ORF type:complete len:139 (-),score=32.99 TRINITY_DN11_c0_g1_i1:36-452(-)